MIYRNIPSVSVGEIHGDGAVVGNHNRVETPKAAPSAYAEILKAFEERLAKAEAERSAMANDLETIKSLLLKILSK